MKSWTGLITTEEPEIKSENRQLIYCDTLIVAKYDKTVMRLVTSLDIQACTGGAPLYRVDRALWDTGATVSGISERLAEEMKIQPVDTGVMLTPSGQKDIVYYLVDIHMSEDMVFRNVKIGAYPLESHDVDFLVGMDIISRGNLNISNTGEGTKFTFEINE